ncbi:hypothetical protein L1887_03193 [Cichorium endivia]|nr:hypothetical protein L1887_03193 [Cichorium endivia]
MPHKANVVVNPLEGIQVQDNSSCNMVNEVPPGSQQTLIADNPNAPNSEVTDIQNDTITVDIEGAKYELEFDEGGPNKKGNMQQDVRSLGTSSDDDDSYDSDFILKEHNLINEVDEDMDEF